MRRHNTLGKIMLKCVESRASQLCMKRCIWLNSQVAQFFFSSAKVFVPDSYGPGGTTTEQTYTISGLCEGWSVVGALLTLHILSQACEKHIQTPFSLWQFQFWSITQAIMLCHVSVHSGTFCCLRHRARDSISVAYFDRVSLRSKRFQSRYSEEVRAWAKKKWKGEGRRANDYPQTPRFWKMPLDISRFGSFVN